MSDQDPTRDPLLAALLRQRDQAAALTGAELDALAMSISARAAASNEWVDWTAGWASTVIPLGVAAGVVAALLLVWQPRLSRSERSEQGRRSSFIEAVRSDATKSRYVDEMIGRPDEGVFGMVIR
jgi:hypothetical protein